MFRDRVDAARRLAEPLKSRDFYDPVVLAIPRGGVVIGAVLAHELGAELSTTGSARFTACRSWRSIAPAASSC
jgi:predicted phosphoribosyltransferase